jgi:hypothetical protein
MERTGTFSANQLNLQAVLVALSLTVVVLVFKPTISFSYAFHSEDGTNWSICAVEDPNNTLISGTSLEPFVPVFLFFLVVVHVTPFVFAIKRPVPEIRGPPPRLS